MKEIVQQLQKRSKYLLALSIVLFTLWGLHNNASSDAASSYPYLIKVNKQQNCVTIYEKNKKGKYTVPVKAMICSTGADTPIGTFKTPARYRWKVLLDNVWGQYCTRINGGILFHSVWYYKQDPSTLSAVQYNKLGTMCSHGCIRLTVADAKWIYDNCPVGTTVTIYNSKDPGPLGKPTAIKLKPNTGWDPTDIYYKNNPFNNKKPSISGAKNKTINVGDKVNLLKGITAKNTTGFSITSRITVSGKVNTKKAGKYKITYKVTDEIGRTAKKTITYTVVGEEVVEEVGTPKITGVKDQVVKGGTEITEELVLKGVTATIGDKKVDASNIQVTIVDNKDKTYSVTYKLVASNGETEKVATEKATFTVDDEAPVIKGAENKEIPWDTKVDEKTVLEGITVSDNTSKLTVDDIKVTIKEKEDRYIVIYTVEDSVGNKTTKTINLIKKDYLVLEGVTDRKVESDVIVDREYLLEGVTAYYNGKDVTDDIELRIVTKYNEDNLITSYIVTYIIYDNMNNDVRKDAIITVLIDE
ncbi:L,D-transpeptidase family protein [Anaerosporobacter faecicola]|uniref:L,D-transpeptidase family protein n=1 Tax=Anaerosporobacter faecicola TaxID=2718714 RepID=UPI00143A2FBC|nr:L,D-transpeptidase family protein [Anaerosporobacter faecicola]